MPVPSKKTFSKIKLISFPFINYWDVFALLLVLSIIFLFGNAVKGMTLPYEVGQEISVSLDPRYLPYYALRSVLRMLISLVFSLLFTFIFGTWAAKSKHAERIIIPIIDVLQSVPVLSFLSLTIVFFIALFPGSLLGPECAAIFAIFTSQAWNIVLSFYQSLRTIPEEFLEAAHMYRLSFWQKFWRIEVPFAMPGLLWNIMVSMSASWFFVVASESITVANHDILLPGIGSYIALAVAQADKLSVIYAILAMLVVILLYDQLLFRPLSSWAERFRFEHEESDEEISSSWFVKILEHTNLFRRIGVMMGKFWEGFVNISFFVNQSKDVGRERSPYWNKALVICWYVLLTITLILSGIILYHFVFQKVPLREGLYVFYLGLITGLRVMVLILLCSFIWVPVGVWIGLRPKWVEFFQPIIQILAAFPANLFYPVVVMLIVQYHLNAEIWTSPLMILGTQWYILFNVIAAASVLPKDFKQVINNFNVTGWLRWKKFILPGIFPFYVTGAITAAGGAWNASIIAEAVSWGSTKIYATGLGAYITQNANLGDFPRLALGTAIMCFIVVVINRVVWQPLYNLAEDRFRLE